MAQGQILSGGAPTQSENLVSADQVTILGDGTKANPLRGAGGIPLLATAAINSDGTVLQSQGVAVVTHVGTGNYSIQLTNPPTQNDVIPQVTPKGTTVPVGYVASVNAFSTIIVHLFDDTNTAADFPFYLTVTNAAG